jgi:hypothetical protein
MEEIKVFMRKMIEEGTVKGHMAGPKNNVLVCDTMADWCVASGELVQAGYNVSSPGGYGGSHPSSRANTHNKIWRSGTVCATVIDRRVHVFSIPIPLPQTVNNYCDVITKKKS